MPDFEFEFNQQDRDIILSQDVGTFGNSGDYIRLTIYPTEAISNVVDLPDDTKGIDGKAVFFSTLNESLKINVSPFTDDERYFEYFIGGADNNFKIYQNGDDVYIKPNEIFNDFELPQGNYRIQIDFLNQLNPPIAGSTGDDDNQVEDDAEVAQKPYQFILRQISTSRKEVRLKLLDKNIENNSLEIFDITNEFNNFESEFIDDGNDNQIPNPNYKYQFKHVLNIGTGDHIPIMNYQFDKITGGSDNQSIILKLYQSLPTNIANLSMVTIEKEVLTTQIQSTFYFSDVPAVFFGDGLQTDYSYNLLNPNDDDFGYQSIDELAYSASIGEVETDTIISSSQYGYPNLNTDFNEFENHTFFGSAKKKLENFKTKVTTIQGYYSEISGTLNVSSSIGGDSTFIIQKRKDLFNKINEEFKNFTPYERFLYYDGQSESTSSSPSLVNYAEPTPVQLGGNSVEGIELNQHNGFNVVYKHTSEKVSGTHNKYIDLFTDKYSVENKPFFNYSSSIYLSFLMQGDSGSSLTWQDFNVQNNPPLPSDTLYQNNVLNPDMTGSAYQRYIFQASMSYFVPNTTNNDLADLSVAAGDFNAGSSKITILSGSIKTGSSRIKDSTNLYPMNVVTQSGVPFKGSVLPSGELFRIYNQNTLSSSLSGSWNVDSQTSGASVTNAMLTDFSGRGNTGSIDEGTPKISDGVTVHGRQYGKSMLFLSESNDSIRYFSDDDFNFNRDDNFSLSIWVKRFHPNTGSADPTKPSSANTQAIFTRGQTGNSYGIDYDFTNNLVRGGVRGTGAQEQITTTATDDLLNWNHIAFTFESGSATGMKLYLNGKLKGTHTTTGAGYSITGSSHFSASVHNISGSGDALSIAGNDIIGGTNGHFNGFLQYPRVYGRTITPSEVNQLYLKPDGNTETKITDVKVTLKDPTKAYPFDNMFKTTSTEWTDWYNGMITSASAFDTDNIHSFENNLPLYIQDSSDYGEMKDFLNLQGEQYDLIRNHIDSMGTLHKRGYTEKDSAPNNTLPMLLSNMGWEAINPFSGSLTDTLGSYLSGITSIDDIKNNTWRKTLNNLLYIYKSKGTKNSVRALLNTYGYPPDVLEFEEFGGATSEGNQDQIVDDTPPEIYSVTSPRIDLDLDLHSGSFSFETSQQKMYRYLFNGKRDRILNLDWWMDNANINTFEFVYKHTQTTQAQTILKSSGSGTETLWDLRLIPSSTGDSSSFQFRLNNSQVADTAIGSRGFSMSSAFFKMTDGELYNVMIQRMTGSSGGPGTIQYKLHAAFQNERQIEKYSMVSMSISGAMAGGTTLGGKGFFANQNWQSSGSRGPTTSSNLFVGEVLSGSLAEIRGWSTALSTSKFRQHVLNKFSIVGNSISSHCSDLTYHFKLNENYSSASISSSSQTLKIIDSAHEVGDYSITKPSSFFSGSFIYGFDNITTVGIHSIENRDYINDNTIIINPKTNIVGDLSYNHSATDLLTGANHKKPQFRTSPKLEIYRSAQSFLDKYILEKLGSFNLEKKYGSPTNYYSESYHELITFKNKFFDCYPIEINVNTFIRAHEDMFNDSISDGLKSLVPARSTFDGGATGVEIKPTILEKQKYRNRKNSLETNPNTATGSHSVNINLSETIYDSVKEGTAQGAPTTSGSSIILPYSQSISLGNNYQTSSMGGDVNYRDNQYITPNFLQPDGYVTTIINPYSASISPLPTYDGTGIETSKDGTINYSSDANKSYVDVHKNWGTSSTDVHHINFAAGTGSYGNYNTYAIDTRFHFYAVGDSEYYSSSLDSGGASDFSDSNRFFNRLLIDNDFHIDSTYESFINTGSGEQSGRMMGKTRYFSSSIAADGTTTDFYPRNHVTKFNNPFTHTMYNGSRNTDPGLLNVRYEDYSTSSFYRVTVTGGENQVYVRSGNPTKDPADDRIIY